MNHYYTTPASKNAAPVDSLPITLKNLQAAGSEGYGFILHTRLFKKGTIINSDFIRKYFPKVLHIMWRMDSGNLDNPVTLSNVKAGLFDTFIVIRDGENKMVDSVTSKEPVNRFKILIDDSVLHFQPL